MKIAMSSIGKDEASLVDPRFGRCRYYALYDTEKASYSFAANVAEAQGGGAGIVAVQQLIDEGVQVILTGSLGPNAYETAESAGIKAYRVSRVPLSRALELFEQGELDAIGEAGPSHSGMHRTT